MPEYIDLHIHSSHSDGLQTPEQIINAGVALNLKAVSITDHDAVSGCVEAVDHAERKGIELIPGIELSASKKDDDIHILGYMVNPNTARLLESLKHFRRIRHDRGKRMVDRLGKLGMKIDFDEVLTAAAGAPVGRPHLAEAMVKNDFVGSYNEAFSKYLGLSGPVYVPKAKLTPAEAIDLIHEAGGLAVMAHPALTKRDEMITELVASGLDGIEIFHPTHNATTRKRYLQLADNYDLLPTGGSDSHNRKGRYGDIGDEKVPYRYLEMMKERWRRNVDRQQ